MTEKVIFIFGISIITNLTYQNLGFLEPAQQIIKFPSLN